MDDFLPYLLLSLNLLVVGGGLFYARRMSTLVDLLNGRIVLSSKTNYAQIEGLFYLYTTLGLRIGLPPLRGWAASPDFLAVLSNHALVAKPAIIVECSSGVSTLVLARTAQMNGVGHVYSMEHEFAFAESTRKLLKQHGLEDWATVLDAPLRTHRMSEKDWLWYSHEVLPDDLRIDLLVIDGPPRSFSETVRYPAGPLLFDRLTANGTVFLDDASRPGERRVLEYWAKEYPLMKQVLLEAEKGCARLVRTTQRGDEG